MSKILFVFVVSLFSFSSFSNISKTKSPIRQSKLPKIRVFKDSQQNDLVKLFLKDEAKSRHIKKIKTTVRSMGKDSIPVLVEVMKSNNFPDKNRWVATFMLGRLMGKKSGAFIVKFLDHPNWVLRLAALKTLQALKMEKYGAIYAQKLKDPSMVVRYQAIEIIKSLKLKKYASHVWAMLYDQKNYSVTSKKRKRTYIIDEAIRCIGDLEFKKALTPLLSMGQKKKYVDIFPAINYSLQKISGSQSPKGTMVVKKNFWKKYQLKTAKL